jgi:hypothetical protein
MISGSLELLATTLEAKWWQSWSGRSSTVPTEVPPGRVSDTTPDSDPSSIRVNTDTARRVSEFIEAVAAATGTRIKKRIIWVMAGYHSRTDFERFQREDTETTDTARKNFNRILQMEPGEFVAAATKRGLFESA